jgi:FTR1 family protein
MSLRAELGRAVAVFAFVGLTTPLLAQEPPAQRVANIVSVAVEEYKRGIDATGRLISAGEYQEAVDFLKDARQVANRLPGARAATAGAILDSVIAAVQAKSPPTILDGLERRFAAALGDEAALELPRDRLDLTEGQRLYQENCGSCHGISGMGDGPAAAALRPRPPAIGSAAVAAIVSPAMVFRKMSIGVTGTAMPPFATTLTAEQRWNVVAYLSSLHRRPEQVAEGEGLYVQGCADCHGAAGGGDGGAARRLSKLPPELASFAWQAQRSDSEIADVIRKGVAGSPMPGAAQLTVDQIQSVVAYLRSLPLRAQATVVAGADDGRATAVARSVLSLLEASIDAARGGRRDEAADRAFDAYIAFEPIESPARARNPGVVASMEKRFADFKGAVRANDVRGAERLRDAIEANLPHVIELTKPTGSGADAFWQSFLIILREGFEAILVIGAVVAFLLRTGHRERLRSIWIGIGLALVASAVTAVALSTILRAIPASSEIIEGATLLVAVAVLFSVSYWLISRVEGAKWQQFIRAKVTSALDHGGGNALAFVAFLAVYREGAETALFYQALFNEGSHVALPITLGIVFGGCALAVIFTLFYRFGVRVPLRPFFGVTSVLLYYMAFVFMGKGVRELQEGDAISITAIRWFPTVDALGVYGTVETLLAQLLLVVLFVFAVAKTFWPKRSVTLPTVPQPDVAADVAADVAGELAELRAENVLLAQRVSELESGRTEANDNAAPGGRQAGQQTS